MKKYLLGAFIALFFLGCSDQFALAPKSVEKTKSSVPEWLNNPGFIQGKRSAIGYAGTHYKGKSEQRKLAISRAVDEIAMQKRTTVSNQTYREGSNGKLKSSKTQSLQSTNNVSISTKVVDEYYDKLNDKLYVLVVEQ